MSLLDKRPATPTPSTRSAGPVGATRREPGRAEIDPVRHAVRQVAVERSLAIPVPVAFLVLWQVASEQEWIDPQFFPSPTQIWDAAVELAEDGELWDAIAVSSRRVLLGFAYGVATGILVGMAMGVSRLLRAALEPLLNALYTVPKLALLPLLLLIFGIGETPKIVLIATTVFFFMWISTMTAIMAVPPGYREAATSFGAGPLQLFRYVLVPAALPQIFVGLRLSAGVSVLVMVGVEFVNGSDGIGYLIWFSWSLFLADRMYVGIVVVALMGLVFTMLVQLVGRLLTPWLGEGGGGGLRAMY